MARQHTTTVYQFSELSDKAKDVARAWYREQDNFFWGEEYTDSLKKFADHFGIRLGRWELDVEAYRTNIPFDCPDLETTYESDTDETGTTETVGEYLRRHADTAFLAGNCPLTGVCFDEELIDAIRANIDNPSREQSDLADVFHDSFRALAKALEADYEHSQSDEAVDESIEANEYEFTENGKRFRG